MARVTVEDCLKRIPNRFFLVHAATKRVRQLREGSDRLIKGHDNEDIVTALREIAAGKVFVTRHYTESKEAAIAPESTPESEAPEQEAAQAEAEPESAGASEPESAPEVQAPSDEAGESDESEDSDESEADDV